MFFVDLMFALVLAMAFSFFVPGAFGWRRPGQELLWDNMVFVFTLIFLISWAGGAWLPMFGPVWMGGYWLPFLLSASFAVILLFAVAPPQPSRTQRRAIEKAEPEITTEKPSGVFFWILVIGLSIAIIIRYLGQVPGLRAVFYDNAK
jgi:hypothetical protein